MCLITKHVRNNAEKMSIRILSCHLNAYVTEQISSKSTIVSALMECCPVSDTKGSNDMSQR